jgi:hypothetical protein
MGRDLAEHFHEQLARRMDAKEFRFTRLVPPSEAYERMTVSQLGRLTREDAVSLARDLGVHRVVWGSLGGLRSDTRTDRWTDAIWRRMKERDAEGETSDRWVEVPFEVIARERDVDVDIELEVISADEETTLAREAGTRSLTTRTLWTSTLPVGNTGDYALMPPAFRSSDSDGAKRIERRWKAVVGQKLSVKQVLERSRKERKRTRYRREYLPSFYPGTTGPVFLNDLPPAEDLAFAALVHEWRVLHEALKRLDPLDDVDVTPAE